MYEYFIDTVLEPVQGAVQPALQRRPRLHAEGHGDRHPQQRHAVFVRMHGPAGRADRAERAGDREGPLLLGPARSTVHLQLRLHRQPHDGQRRRQLRGRRPRLEGRRSRPGSTRCSSRETDFSIAIFRTQLFDPADIDNVKASRPATRPQPLSAFLGQPAPPAAPAVEWPKIDKALAEADPFGYLNFLLQFGPPTGPAAVEAPLRAAFARIGIEAGKPFAAEGLARRGKAALEAGVKAGLAKIEERVASRAGGQRLAARHGRLRRPRGATRATGRSRRGGDGRHLRQRRGGGALSAPRHRQRGEEARRQQERYTLTFPPGNCRRSTPSGR